MATKTQTALLSVHCKDGIVEFARELTQRGWQILASGGTAKVLMAGSVRVRDIAEIVGEPILGHRVVTLSREIHAMLLARKLPEDEQEIARLSLPRVDLVCVDLYPLQATIDLPNATRESVIEMTDVGGPTMLHSGAKGERFVICDPIDRMPFIEWLDKGRPDEGDYLDYLDAKADAVVTDYCLISSRYRSHGRFDGVVGERVQVCKYGENAWQTPAGLYRQLNVNDPLALHNFRHVAGDAPSYNNWCDIDRMLTTITYIITAFHNFRTELPLTAVGVKHGNACGAAVGRDDAHVTSDMLAGDLRAIFGGLVMLTYPVDEAIAALLREAHIHDGSKRLLDGVVAPSFTEESIELLARKGGKCRLIANPALESLNLTSLNREPRFRQVRGGFLRQPNYTYVPDLWDPRIVRHGEPSRQQEVDLLLASAIGRTSNSNTITLVKNRQLIGNGVGQQDRVGAAELAVKRARDAGHDPYGAVAYSDSFFPFPDGPEVLANAGIKAILTSSGSRGDDEVIALCAAKGVSLIMIPDAVGRGFFGH